MTVSPVLRVVVSAGCATCGRAVEIVDAVRRLRPRQPVEVLDLDDRGARAPIGIVGTPTFLLGEQVISLGNPTLEVLLGTLDAARRGGGPGNDAASA